uniref:ribonuclease P protein subunit p21-like n=1 Tax=Styela clava TaxID=7725 RepID=UPI0019394552|nr:ribonuclease P protein subunit p21-like [Styela clava]
MGKSKRQSIHQKDVFHRLNYLYQAAHTVLTINPMDWDLSRHYTNTLRTLAKKNVLRLHPHLKRTLCKGCDLLLIPGITSKVRTSGKRENHIIIECLHCDTLKRFLCKNDYVLWHDNPKNIKEIVILEKRSIVFAKTGRGKQLNEKRQTEVIFR